MLTSIEIAKLLQKQQQSQKKSEGFDKALLGLGIRLKNTRNKIRATK